MIVYFFPRIAIDKLVVFLAVDKRAHEALPFEKARLIVRFFYYHLIFLSFLLMLWTDSYAQRPNFSPVWSLAWTDWLSAPIAINAIRFFFLASALVGGWWHDHWMGRLVAFTGVFQFHAMVNSFGITNHQWLPWLYASFLFLFLPDARAGREASYEERKKFLFIVWGAQAVFLSTYFLSGFGKIYWSFWAEVQGDVSALAPSALARHIITELSRVKAIGIFGSFFAQYPLAGWPLSLGAVYLQFFSLWAAFRPALHKLWAFGLVMFHIGSYLIMNIVFFEPVVLLLILLASSPLENPRQTWRDTARDLPLFGWIFRVLMKPVPF